MDALNYWIYVGKNASIYQNKEHLDLCRFNFDEGKFAAIHFEEVELVIWICHRQQYRRIYRYLKDVSAVHFNSLVELDPIGRRDMIYYSI